MGNQLFRNRMFSAPMGGTDITKDCTVGPKSTAFYEYRAKGGVASVTVSELVVHPGTEHSHMYHLDLETVDSLSSFTYTADAIRRHGAIASVELSHSGQFAGTYLVDKKKKGEIVQWGPSEGVRPDGRKVCQLTKPLIDEIVKSYGEKAALAKKAGFQMVMVHGGHGWLINQFLSPFFNKRDDEYGGSLENRCRFLLEVLDSVRSAVGKGFPVELRMSGSELFDGGYTLDEGVEIAKLAQSKIDLLHVSAGSYQKGFGITHPSMFVDHGVNVYMAARIKQNVDVPVATVGGLNDPDMMEEIIASGKADVVEMARALLADPELPYKVVTNQDQYIRHCLRCFVCMAERAETSTRRCAVNPYIGREIDGTEILPARIKKKVLVVGAGPAGLQAACTAAKRGHQVILCDKGDEVGGVLVGEKAIPFKYEMYKLGVTLGDIALKEGVDIRLGTMVDKEYANKIGADVIIAATGSVPFKPPVPGIDGEQVITVTDYHHHHNEVKDKVAVMGGGLSGCEIAVHLAREGKQVSIVEMRGELCPDANIRHRPLLLQEIEKQGIDVYSSHTVTGILENSLKMKNPDGEEIVIPAETVISALGQKANDEAAMPLLDCAPLVHMIGDCKGVSNITNAVYAGHHIAMDI
ncbi:MAG: NAD(P)/FAD-dependent oxidoreductase [Spirochaetales bacterium]|nr:NAD(P)/FAD-dependent oxidoreductase [Spirochaetales bacterium]